MSEAAPSFANAFVRSLAPRRALPGSDLSERPATAPPQSERRLRQFQQVDVVSALAFYPGYMVGLGIGLASPITDVAQAVPLAAQAYLGLLKLQHDLVFNPVHATMTLFNGMKQVKEALDGFSLTQAAREVVYGYFPGLKETLDRFNGNEFVSFEGGKAFGTFLGGVVVQVAPAIATGGATALVKGVLSVVTAAAKVAAKGIAVVAATTARAVAVAKQAAHLSVLQRAKAALRPLGQAAERIEDAGKAVARRTEAYPLRMAYQDACFVAGTPLLTPEGPRPIETLREGDWVLSRDEHDSAGPIEPRRVLRTFVRTAMVLTLRVGGQTIRTTAEHPFWVANCSAWIPAGMLEVGDLLEGHDGKRLPVETIVDGQEAATVYNVEVEQFHTYFVGCQEWGFSLWAHNAEYQVFADVFGTYSIRYWEGTGSHRTLKVLETPNGNPIRFRTAAEADTWIARNVAPPRQVTSTVRHKHGTQTVVVDGQTWHLPQGRTVANIPPLDTVGDRLQALASQHAQRWDGSQLTAPQRRAIQEQIDKGRPYVAKIYEARYRGSWIEDQVRASAQREFPHLQWNERGIDVIDHRTGFQYDILSGSVGNMTEHAQRLRNEMFRMVTFPTR